MYDLKVADGPGYLRFTVSGIQDLRTDAEIDAAIGDECEKHGASAALVDIRGLIGRLTIIENHEAAKSFLQRMPRSLRKVAIVDVDEYEAESKMFELTANNRGANVRFFTRIEEAESWLGTEIRERPDNIES